LRKESNTIDRARELDRAALLVRLRHNVGCRQDLWQVAFGFGENLGEVRKSLAQGRQLGAIVRPLGKTLFRRHNATP
jgi:hypothetical protein